MRTNYSNPPAHGGQLVAAVLGNPELRQLWEQELGAMRERIKAMRASFNLFLAELSAANTTTFGALLGVFLLGVLTRGVREREAIAGVLVGLSVICYVRFETNIAWTWYVLIGTTATFAVGYLASLGRSHATTD